MVAIMEKIVSIVPLLVTALIGVSPPGCHAEFLTVGDLTNMRKARDGTVANRSPGSSAESTFPEEPNFDKLLESANKADREFEDAVAKKSEAIWQTLKDVEVLNKPTFDQNVNNLQTRLANFVAKQQGLVQNSKEGLQTATKATAEKEMAKNEAVEEAKAALVAEIIRNDEVHKLRLNLLDLMERGKEMKHALEEAYAGAVTPKDPIKTANEGTSIASEEASAANNQAHNVMDQKPLVDFDASKGTAVE